MPDAREVIRDALWKKCAPKGHVYDDSESVSFVVDAVLAALSEAGMTICVEAESFVVGRFVPVQP